jgi:hypothetical protein
MYRRIHSHEVMTYLKLLDTASDILLFKFSMKESPSTDLLRRLEAAKKQLKNIYLGH